MVKQMIYLFLIIMTLASFRFEIQVKRWMILKTVGLRTSVPELFIEWDLAYIFMSKVIQLSLLVLLIFLDIAPWYIIIFAGYIINQVILKYATSSTFIFLSNLTGSRFYGMTVEDIKNEYISISNNTYNF